MEKGLQKKIYTAYGVVLTLGAILAAFVYIFSSAVLDTSVSLVRQTIPQLEQITALRQNLVAQERLLYEYYTTGNRGVFFQEYLERDSEYVEKFAALERDFPESRELPMIRNEYAVIRNLVKELDLAVQTMRETPERAQQLITASGSVASQIHSQLQALDARTKGRVTRSSETTESVIFRMQVLVIVLSGIIFIISLFVGYHINGYMRGQAERRRLATFPERNPSPILRLSKHGRVLYANPGTTVQLQRMGFDPREPAKILPRDLSERLGALRQAEDPHGHWCFSIGKYALECDIHYLQDSACFHAYIADVTHRKRAEERLVFQAYHDALTGLPNRRRFQELLAEGLRRRSDEPKQVAVLLLGLDRFKVVIGSLGHTVGDALLKAVAERLRRVLDDTGEVAASAELCRFEGDMFSCLLIDCVSEEAPVLVAERLAEALRVPLNVNEREFFLTLSIGISLGPSDGNDAVSLLKNADTAMQRAKQQGGDTVQCYTQDMNARATEWLKLENDLRRAEESGELRVYYQPQIDARTGSLVGMEALLRWRHPDRGIVSPADFIPLAEETGLIVPIGEWLMRAACVQNQFWANHKLGALTVAVNVSARQFHGQDLPALVRRVLDETGLSPGKLELEITESVAMQDVERTISTLCKLKEMGVQLAIDDFGTGFSSLNYLQRFPIDKLKVDQSFVRNITHDENDAAIAQAIISLGHSLHLKVIAEGVETGDQLEHLRRTGCDEVQGFLFSAPLSAHQFTRSVQQGHRMQLH